jgi:glycosyltransferase involved in cell wall biosynthesis
MEIHLEKQDLDMLSGKIKKLIATFDCDLYKHSLLDVKPFVSVCVICYKHEQYIGKCLESLVSQVTNFDYEIVIGDDYSPDQTAQIVRQYADKYPNKIKAYLHHKNLSQLHRQYPPSKLNFLHALSNCSGQYVVYIEGDDYLTDNNKLQLQADYMEANPSVSACFHNAQVVYEDNTGRTDELLNPADQKTVITATDLIADRETWFMATAAVMFRANMVFPLPEWFAKSKSGDIPLYFLLSQKGNIHYLPPVMSVYRRHLGGMSFTDLKEDAEFVENRIFMYANMNQETNGQFASLFNPILSHYYLLLCQAHQYKQAFFKKLYFTIYAYWLKKPDSWQEAITHLENYVMTQRMIELYHFIKPKTVK